MQLQPLKTQTQGPSEWEPHVAVHAGYGDTIRYPNAPWASYFPILRWNHIPYHLCAEMGSPKHLEVTAFISKQQMNACLPRSLWKETKDFRFWFCFYLSDTLTPYLFFEKLIYANSVWLSFLFKISSAPRFWTNSFLMLLSDRMPVSPVNMGPGLGQLVGLPWMLSICVSPPVRCHELIWVKQWALLKQDRQDSNSSFLFYLLASLPPQHLPVNQWKSWVSPVTCSVSHLPEEGGPQKKRLEGCL